MTLSEKIDYLLAKEQVLRDALLECKRERQTLEAQIPTGLLDEFEKIAEQAFIKGDKTDDRHN